MSKQPRPSNKYLTEKDIYKDFDNKEISAAQFKLICNTFFHLLTKSMIEEGKIYYLPPKLGTIGIYKIGKTKKMLDFDLYKKTGYKVNIRNLHTHGSMVKVHWQTQWPRFRVANYGDPVVFRFKLARAGARELAKQIKQNNTINKYYDY